MESAVTVSACIGQERCVEDQGYQDLGSQPATPRRGERRLSRALQVLSAIGTERVAYSDMVGRFGFTSARLSYLLQILERSGLITRHKSLRDFRRIEIELTPEGLGVFNRISCGEPGVPARLWGRGRRALPAAGKHGRCRQDVASSNDAIAGFFSDLIKLRLVAMSQQECLGVGAAIVMALSSIDGSKAAGAIGRADLDALVADFRASVTDMRGDGR